MIEAQKKKNAFYFVSTHDSQRKICSQYRKSTRQTKPICLYGS